MNHNTLRKRIFAMITVLALVISGISWYSPVVSHAASVAGGGVVSNNIHDHNYTTNSKVANSYLINNNNGTLTRVENMGDVILIENYNSSLKLVSQGAVAFELSRFGGCYSDANYNYLVFGQDNPNNYDAAEVVRIVKYTKSWVRVSQASVTSCNTRVPFTGENTDFTEYGGYLYIRMGHTTFNGQQANMTISYQIAADKVTDIQSAVGTTTGNYCNVGASYINATDGVLVAVDGSLTSPYSVSFLKYGARPGSNKFQSNCARINCLGSVNAINNASTDYTLGGMAASSQYYLAVGTTTPMDGTCTNHNVYVAAVPKGNFGNGGTALVRYMTGYSGGNTTTCTNPFIVQISADQFMVLWETKQGEIEQQKVSYVMIDGQGNKTTDIKQIDGCLSDCQPIVFGGKVVWYTTNGANMKFYTIAVPGSSQTTAAARQYVYGGVDYSAVFDFSYYCNTYPDIRVIYGNNPSGALAHFVNNGIPEGRQGSANFNVNTYKNNYPDLQAAFGNNLRAYYNHFITTGNAEGRNGRTAIR